MNAAESVRAVSAPDAGAQHRYEHIDDIIDLDQALGGDPASAPDLFA